MTTDIEDAIERRRQRLEDERGPSSPPPTEPRRPRLPQPVPTRPPTTTTPPSIPPTTTTPPTGSSSTRPPTTTEPASGRVSPKGSVYGSLTDLAELSSIQIENNDYEREQRRNTSLWAQATGAIGSGPAGALQFGRAVLQAPGRIAQVGPDAYRMARHAITGQEWSGIPVAEDANAWQEIQAGFRRYLPLAADISTGVYDTADKISALHNPLDAALTGALNGGDYYARQREARNELQEAIDNGTIVQTLIEDYGNAAVAAGGAGAALGRTSSLVGGRSLTASNRALTGANASGVIARRGTGLAGYLERRGVARSTVRGSDFTDSRPTASTTARTKPMSQGMPESSVRPPRSNGFNKAPDWQPPKGPQGRTANDLGEGFRQLGVEADWLDPSTPFIQAALGATGIAGRAALRTKRGSRLVTAIASRRTAAEARDLTDRETVEAMRTSIESQFNLDNDLANLDKSESGGVDFSVEDVRDLYGTVPLNLADGRINELYKANIAAIESYVPFKPILDEFNAREANVDTQITQEMIDVYSDYRNGTMPKPIRDLIDKALNTTIESYRTRTERQIERGAIEGANLELPSANLVFDQDGSYVFVRELAEIDSTSNIPSLSQAQIDARVADGTYTTAKVNLLDLPQTIVDKAFKDGLVDMPYLPRVIDNLTTRLDNQKSRLVEKMDPLIEKVRELEYKIGFSEAARAALPDPGTNVPFRDSLAGRQFTTAAEKTILAGLERDLDRQYSLLSQTSEKQQSSVQQTIDNIEQQIVEIQNSATRLELDSIASFDTRISELLTLNRKTLVAQAKTAGVEGSLSRMNKQKLAEALAGVDAPSLKIREEAATQISAAETGIANLTRAAEAVAEQQTIVNEAVATETIGVNTTPDDMWMRPDDQVQGTSERNPITLTEASEYAWMDDRPGEAEGIFESELYDPESEFNQQPVAFNDEGAVFATEFEPPPVEGTRVRGSMAEEMTFQAGMIQQEYNTAVRELQIAKMQVESVQRQADYLNKSLARTQQADLKRASAQGIEGLQEAVQVVNAGGQAVGAWVPHEGGGGHLTGIMGDLAQKWGIAETIAQQINIAEASKRVQERKMRQIYNEMGPNQKKIVFDQDGVRNADDFVKVEIQPQVVGRINIATRVFQDVLAQKLNERKFTQKHGESYKLEIDRFNHALLAQELSLVLDDVGRFSEEVADPKLGGRRNLDMSNQTLSGFAAFQHLQSTIHHLPPHLKKIADSDVVDKAIQNAHKTFRDKYFAEINNISNEMIAAIPAPFRDPIMNARQTVAAIQTQAIEAMEGNTHKGIEPSADAAYALELLVRDVPTSWEAYVQDASNLTPAPIKLVGGSSGARTGPFKNISAKARGMEAPATRAESKRTTGSRVSTLRGYASVEAREMTRLSTQAGVKRIANDSRYSSNILDVIGDDIAEWMAQPKVRPLTFRDMQNMLEEHGYEVMWNVTEDTFKTPETVRFEQSQASTHMDEAGVNRLPMIGEGKGRDADIFDIPDFNERNWRNGLDEFPDVRVMDKRMAAQVKQYQDPFSHKYLQMYDQMTQLWKTTVLPWSSAWVTYNAIGNALMATFSAGNNPFMTAAAMMELRARAKEFNIKEGKTKPGDRTSVFWQGFSGKKDMTSDLSPGRLATHGLNWAEKQSTMKLGADDTFMGGLLDYVGNKDRSWMGRVTEHSYALNEFTDNLFRSTVHLNDLQKRLPEIPAELLNAEGGLRSDLSPEQMEMLTQHDEATALAQNQSITTALNTMGDFTRLSPVERAVVKRAIPFYPWLRHQTAMTFRMPFQNPLRFAFMASLDNIIGQDEDPTVLESLLGSHIMLGPTTGISLKPMVPFGSGLTAFGGDSGTPLSRSGLIGPLNPIAKFLPTTLMGYDSQGGDVSRPLGQTVEGEWGPLDNSGFTRAFRGLFRMEGGDVRGGLGELAYQTLGQTPLTKAARDIALSSPAFPGGSELPRYGSGNVVENADPRWNPGWLQGARLFRPPFLPRDMTYQIERAEDKDADRHFAETSAQRQREAKNAPPSDSSMSDLMKRREQLLKERAGR